ncbi:hypothetical protein E4634_16120 [Mangrovimicrobium sediminis]|uniref:Uncharacterized protein n=1 Tax=Mangrovimicrobium sediminis TaxID=2562682 RepID=A0A4Z0LXY0_9GAMM|nr:hypothetical protein E4634_16120 [Haliea sp. SAOS-164]
MSSTKDWKYDKVEAKFKEIGCIVSGCEFNHPQGCKSASVLCCALNLSDAVISAGYSLPSASNVNYCPHGRVRNADGMARVTKSQNSGAIDATGWANKPSWKGIVYFEGGLALSQIYDGLTRNSKSLILATGHIDLWNGSGAVHAEYPDAATIWFWRLG